MVSILTRPWGRVQQTGHLPSLLSTMIPDWWTIARGGLTFLSWMEYNKAMRERKRFTEKAKRLRDLRERAGYTITELYMRSGVAENVISRVELYGYIPTERTIRKLAAVLGDGVWELFREEDF